MNNSQRFWRGLFFILVVTALCAGLALPAFEGSPAHAAPQMDAASHIVISQVYGGGGNSGATFTNDFIELFNRATTAVDLTGWSVQYASATGSGLFSSNVANLSGTINPGQYYLVQLASGGTVGGALPTPNATGTIDLSAANGKIVLANTTTGLPCNGGGTPCTGSDLVSIVDLIGYGTANFFEGSGAAPAADNTTANLRNSNGCSDTNNNNADFTAGAPSPRNSASPANPCTSITITDVTSSVPDNTYTTGAVIDITITFNGPVNVAGSPTLLLETGVIDRPATYASGSGTNALLFNYTVTVGDSSGDLDYVAANSLSGGTITGATGEAIPTLPSPGSPGSLGANKNIVIDTPSLISTTTTITGDSPDPSVVNGNVTVSVSVTGSGLSPAGTKVNITGANTNCTITLNSSGTGSCSVKFTSSGTKTLTATYLGDNTHAGSSATTSHSVSSAVKTPTKIRTATPKPLPPPPLVAINEFVPRPGHDWNLDGVVNTDDEYIEILNHGVIDVSLSGYSLDDEANIGSSPYRLPAVTIKPGERMVFYGSQTGLLLSDGGDGVRLLKPNGQLADAYNYYVVRFPDQSYCRLPDNGGLDDWNQNCFPTPGLQNSLSGSSVNPPTSGDADSLCPIADTLPDDFVFAECLPFGNNIWNPAYWDRFGWFDEKSLPESPGKWPVFAD